MTLQEYANSRGISFTAANNCFKRHKSDLKGQWTKDGERKPIKLSKKGVAIMDTFRRTPSVPKETEVVNPSWADEIAELRKENERLRNELSVVEGKLVASQEEVISTMRDYKKLADKLLIEEKKNDSSIFKRLFKK